MSMKYLRYILAIVEIILVPILFAFAGGMIGLEVLWDYSVRNEPFVEFFGGILCGGIIGLIFATFLAVKIWPRSKKQKYS